MRGKISGPTGDPLARPGRARHSLTDPHQHSRHYWHIGFDGIMYKSSLNLSGYDYVLFNARPKADADRKLYSMASSRAFLVRGVGVRISQIAPWPENANRSERVPQRRTMASLVTIAYHAPASRMVVDSFAKQSPRRDYPKRRR